MKCLGMGVAVTGREEGLCKMAPGAFVDLLALYDTLAERSMLFSLLQRSLWANISNISRSYGTRKDV